MSWYTIFDEQESVISSTTTSVMGATDVLLGHSYVTGKKHQIPVQSALAGPETLQVLTSATTATNLNPFGVTSIQSSNALSFLMSAPLANNTSYSKIVVTTSTAVITVVCSGASLYSTGSGAGGSQFIFNSAGASLAGGGISLASVGTTRWVTVGYSATTILS